MSSKLKIFKPKTRKGAKKRIKISSGGNPMEGKLIIKRINHAHRLINKQGERKLKSARTTTLGKTQRKYKKSLAVNF